MKPELVNPLKPLTMDCEVWARQRHQDLSTKFKARFLCIEPQLGYVGPYKLPQEKGGTWWPGPNKSGWAHHYAVIIIGEDLVMDELYPDGVPLGVYKTLFKWNDSLQFVIRDKPESTAGEYV